MGVSNDDQESGNDAADPPPLPHPPPSAFGLAREAAAAAVAVPEIADIQAAFEEPQSSEHSAESSPVSLLRKSPRKSPIKSPRSPNSPDEEQATSSKATTSSSQPRTSGSHRQLEEKLLLTPEQESHLVDYFENHPEFWDKENSGFKRKAKKQALIDDLAKELDLVGSSILTWFQSQRSMYGRLLKKTQGSSGIALRMATARQKWNLANFSFLRSHVAARTGARQMGGLEPPPKEPIVLEEEDQEEVAEEGCPTGAVAAADVLQPGPLRAWTATAT